MESDFASLREKTAGRSAHCERFEQIYNLMNSLESLRHTIRVRKNIREIVLNLDETQGRSATSERHMFMTSSAAWSASSRRPSSKRRTERLSRDIARVGQDASGCREQIICGCL